MQRSSRALFSSFCIKFLCNLKTSASGGIEIIALSLKPFYYASRFEPDSSFTNWTLVRVLAMSNSSNSVVVAVKWLRSCISEAFRAICVKENSEVRRRNYFKARNPPCSCRLITQMYSCLVLLKEICLLFLRSMPGGPNQRHQKMSFRYTV